MTHELQVMREADAHLPPLPLQCYDCTCNIGSSGASFATFSSRFSQMQSKRLGKGPKITKQQSCQGRTHPSVGLDGMSFAFQIF